MSEVLVLDRAYRPHRVATWQDAICLVVGARAQVIETYPDRDIHAVSVTLKMPAVIRLLDWAGTRKHGIKFSRINIFIRDNYQCQFCGTKLPISKLNYDHVVPRSQGGKTEWRNVVTSCYPCNDYKANRTPEQAGMRLRCKPVRPDSLPLTQLWIDPRSNIPKEWSGYWTVRLEP